MKKILLTSLCFSVLLMSCAWNQMDTSSYFDDTSEKVSETASSSDMTSDESYEITSSKEDIFEFTIDAKTAVERISDELSLTADVVEMDEHFLYEKTSISNDMYDDFYGTTSYKISDNSFLMVFCCNTAVKAISLKEHIENAISGHSSSSIFDSNTKVVSYNGYIIVVSTKSNFNEENLTSKLIQ